jgi:hypothetical protein
MVNAALNDMQRGQSAVAQTDRVALAALRQI